MLPAGHLRDENKNIISPDRVTEGQVIRIYWSLGHFMFGDDAGDCLEPCRVIKFVNGDDDLTNMVDGDDDRGDDGGDAADEQMEEPSGEGGEPDGADASDQAQRGEQLVGDETQHHSHADSHTPRPPAAHESTSQGSGEAKLPEEVGTFGRVESSNDGVPAEDGLESLYRHPVIKTPAVDGMELMNESATNSHDPSFGDFFADEVDEPSMEVANVPPLPSLKHPFPTPAEEVDRKKAKSDRPQHDDSMMDSGSFSLNDDVHSARQSGGGGFRASGGDVMNIPLPSIGGGSSDCSQMESGQEHHPMDTDDDFQDESSSLCGQKMDAHSSTSYRDAPRDSDSSDEESAHDDESDSDFVPSECNGNGQESAQPGRPSRRRPLLASSASREGSGRRSRRSDGSRPAQEGSTTSLTGRDTSTQLSGQQNGDMRILQSQFFKNVHKIIQNGNPDDSVASSLMSVSQRQLDEDPEFRSKFPGFDTDEKIISLLRECVVHLNRTLIPHLRDRYPGQILSGTVSLEGLKLFLRPLPSDRSATHTAVISFGRESFRIHLASNRIKIDIGPAFNSLSNTFFKNLTSGLMSIAIAAVASSMGVKTYQDLIKMAGNINAFATLLQDWVLSLLTQYDEWYAFRQGTITFSDKNPAGRFYTKGRNSHMCPLWMSPAEFYHHDNGCGQQLVLPRSVFGSPPKQLVIPQIVGDHFDHRMLSLAAVIHLCRELRKSGQDKKGVLMTDRLFWLYSELEFHTLISEESRNALIEKSAGYAVGASAPFFESAMRNAANDNLCLKCSLFLDSNTYEEYTSEVRAQQWRLKHSSTCGFRYPQGNNPRRRTEELQRKVADIPSTSTDEYEKLDDNISSLTLDDVNDFGSFLAEGRRQWLTVRGENPLTRMPNSSLAEFVLDFAQNHGEEIVRQLWLGQFTAVLDDFERAERITADVKERTLDAIPGTTSP